MQFKILQTISVFLPSAFCATYYVSPTGSDSGAGSLSAPYKSIQVAVDKAVAGDSIFLRGGTYSPTKNIQIKKSGTSSSRITLAAYQSEIPIIDGEALTGTPAPLGGSISSADRGILHIENAAYWTIKGIQLINGPYGVYAANANNNIFQQLVTRQNYETGFQLQGTSANNQILYLDSYENRDPRKNGESADGIGIKEGSGTGNILKGARLWNNVDDGLDFWEFKSKITVVDTISWVSHFRRLHAAVRYRLQHPRLRACKSGHCTGSFSGRRCTLQLPLSIGWSDFFAGQRLQPLGIQRLPGRRQWLQARWWR